MPKYNSKNLCEQLEQIKAMNAEGSKVSEIAIILGCAPASIRKMLKKHSINIAPVPPKLKDAECQVCRKIFIYKYSGRNKVCSEVCRRQAISLGKTKYTKADKELVMALRTQGLKIKEIEKQTGININTVKKINSINGLLSVEERQHRCKVGRLASNPEAYADMRNAYLKKATSSESLEAVKAELLLLGWEYVSGFTKKTSSFLIRCQSCNNKRETSKLWTVQKGACASCSNTGVSKPEKEIADWIAGLGLIAERYKFETITNGREIDVYVPEKGIGIEYCGLYWHNENSPWPRDYSSHLKKLKKAQSVGIRLITIFEDEWLKRGPQVRGFLAAALGKTDKVLGARSCLVKSVEKSIAKNFLEKNHIQGAVNTEAYFGLYNKNELVGIVSGGKHHRGNPGLVLNRLAFASGLRIAGGASRLVSALSSWGKLQGLTKLITWSDNRWSAGKVYAACGFEKKAELPPDYSYVYKGLRLPKQSCTKKVLLSRGAVGNTESEMAKSLGYSRIWDCGKIRWEIEIP